MEQNQYGHMALRSMGLEGIHQCFIYLFFCIWLRVRFAAPACDLVLSVRSQCHFADNRLGRAEILTAAH